MNIDRSQEPQSTKVLQGISEFSDFKYMYDEAGNFTHIIAQLQTGAGQIREFSPLKNDDQWFSNISRLPGSGVTSNFSTEKAASVKELVPKLKTKKNDKSKQLPKKSSKDPTPLATASLLMSCEYCGKKFLRASNLGKHAGSKLCSKLNPDLKKRKTNEQLMNDVEAGLGKSVETIKTAHNEKMEKHHCGIGITSTLLLKEIQGSASKTKKPKKEVKKFTDAQKQVMIDCYNAGKENKSKRFTPAMCVQMMAADPAIGRENTLKESQIRSFWSRYHRKTSHDGDI